MKISKSWEQGVFVVLMLALQKEHSPVKSYVLSKKLEVSDSYLKKILRRLVVAGIIESSASKDGGFRLARPVDKISLYDVYIAVEGSFAEGYQSELARRIFPNQVHVEQSEAKIRDCFQSSERALQSLPLSDLLEEGKWEHGAVDWNAF